MLIARIHTSDNIVVAIEQGTSIPVTSINAYYIDVTEKVANVGDVYDSITGIFSPQYTLSPEQDGFDRTERYRKQLRAQGLYTEALLVTNGRR